MARLNEMPVSSDSVETLRKKMLRQNRDLAKVNNVRALRIRELENECACMLSENLELRSRILDLEKQVEDNETRRIADHAMAIKVRLESQLTEWSMLLAGLGLEPPMKRHSPVVRRNVKQRVSLSASRPSPSQRRLRDVARDIEDLGYIAENKSYPRKSMNPEQIMALRSEADFSVESPELGPPPMSKYIDEDPMKIDSPSRGAAEKSYEQIPVRAFMARVESSISLRSPETDKGETILSSPVTKEEPASQMINLADHVDSIIEAPTVELIKAGLKRKLAVRDNADSVQRQRIAKDNDLVRMLAEKTLLQENAGDKAMKEPIRPKKGILEKQESLGHPRKPLAAKSTNDDISSPKKNPKVKAIVADEVAIAKVNAVKSKSAPEQTKARSRNPQTIKTEAVLVPDIVIASPSAKDLCDLAVPVMEPVPISPVSPQLAASLEGPRGDTPPPFDVPSRGEVSRPNRRNRAAVSYAEPNLRHKMRRPTKELFDAVTGEGKYTRRSSQCDPAMPEPTKVEHQSDAGEAWKQMPDMADTVPSTPEPDSVPASPIAGKGISSEDLPSSVVMERRKRASNMVAKVADAINDSATIQEADTMKDINLNLDSSEPKDVDVYEFTSASPQPDKDVAMETKRSSRRQTTLSRRSTAVEDVDITAKDQNGSRRRSMMV